MPRPSSTQSRRVVRSVILADSHWAPKSERPLPEIVTTIGVVRPDIDGGALTIGVARSAVHDEA